MRLSMTSINILTDEVGTPLKLKGQGRDRDVRVRRVLDCWRYGGHWWLGEAPRDYYLLELETSHVFEVFRCEECWVLSRVSD